MKNIVSARIYKTKMSFWKVDQYHLKESVMRIAGLFLTNSVSNPV